MNEDVIKDETAGFEVVASDMPEIEPEKPEVEPEVATATEEVEVGEGEKERKPEAVEEEASKVKRPSRRDRRIDKLIRSREDTRRENEKLQGRISELEKAPEKKDLSEDDFDTYDEYLEALDDLDKGKVVKKDPIPAPASQELQQPALTDSQQSAMAVLHEAVDVKDRPDDFEQVAMNPELHVTGEMIEALAECDDPAGIMYHLGQNTDVAADIAALSPVQQMREIARLDLKGIKPIKPVKLTASSPPISPVGGSGAGQKAVGEMSFSEYEKHMNTKERETSAW